MAIDLCRRVLFGLTIAVAIVSPARAVFFPGVEFPDDKRVKEKGYWASLPDEFNRILKQQVMGLTVNADYHYGTQDIIGRVEIPGRPRFEGDSEVNTYTIRPEIVLTNWLSIYGVGALHEGSSSAAVVGSGGPGASFSLDGWGVGAGVTAALGLPRWRPEWTDKMAFDPLFVVPDLNWTHNDFDGIENAVDIVNVTTRIGAAMRTRFYNAGMYAGPMFQTSTRDLTLKSLDIAVDSQPKDAWSGVVGAFVGTWFSKDPDHVRRPTAMLTVEGGVGNRQGVLVSLRYEYDLIPQTRD